MFIGGDIFPAIGAIQEQSIWIPVGGSAPFDPTLYGTVVEYLNADDISGVDSDVITNWPAQIGSDAAPTGSPLLRTGANGISGRNAVQLDGSTQYLTTGSLSLRTLFAVVKGGDASLQGVSSFNGSSTARLGLIFPDDTHWYTGDGSDIIIFTVVNGVTTFAHSASAREVVSGTRGDIQGGSPVKIGSGGFGLFHGLISMWLAYSDAPDMATVQAAILAQYP